MTVAEQAVTCRPAGIEGRTQTRYRCHERTLVQFVVKPSFRCVHALVHDVSLNGIGFLIDQPLEAGVMLALQFSNGSYGATHKAKVMHVRRSLPVGDAPWIKKKPFLKSLLSFFHNDEQDSQRPAFIYLVGCRFDPPLALEDLHRLCDAAPV